MVTVCASGTCYSGVETRTAPAPVADWARDAPRTRGGALCTVKKAAASDQAPDTGARVAGCLLWNLFGTAATLLGTDGDAVSDRSGWSQAFLEIPQATVEAEIKYRHWLKAAVSFRLMRPPILGSDWLRFRGDENQWLDSVPWRRGNIGIYYSILYDIPSKLCYSILHDAIPF